MTEDTKNDNLSLNDELQVYELGFHLLPTVAEENLEKEVSAIKAILEKNGALFIGEEGSPKTIKLSYSISKVISNKKTDFDTAYFGWIKFEGSPESAIKINEELKKIENVLRFLLIKSVRESKMVSRKPMMNRISQTPKTGKPKKEKKEEVISEVEVDQAIEELVVE